MPFLSRPVLARRYAASHDNPLLGPRGRRRA
jgi:hypothetical protein